MVWPLLKSQLAGAALVSRFSAVFLVFGLWLEWTAFTQIREALRGRDGLSVVMLTPAGRMTAFQRAQMFSLLDDNIVNVAVDGVFDDCQDLVKAVNMDAAFKARWHLGAVNSINWARLLAQVVYYVATWLRATEGSSGGSSSARPRTAVSARSVASFAAAALSYQHTMRGARRSSSAAWSLVNEVPSVATTFAAPASHAAIASI